MVVISALVNFNVICCATHVEAVATALVQNLAACCTTHIDRVVIKQTAKRLREFISMLRRQTIFS